MSVDKYCCICLDYVVPCGPKINHMTDEQLIKFNKYVAKHTKKVMVEKEIELSTYRMQLKVKVTTVRPPKNRWENFRVNVKVVESKVKTAIWNEDGSRKRDEQGNIVYEYRNGIIRRSDVNGANRNIRREVESQCKTMLDFFGINGWRVRVEKVTHIK